MIKKYYVEINEKGEEVKRTLTTSNDVDNFLEFSLDEMLDIYYQVSAELSSKARKLDLVENYITNISKGKELTKEQRQILMDASNNVTDTTYLLLGE